MDSFVKSIKKLIKSCDCICKCNAKRFKQDFRNWTSGNKHIDNFIQDTQLSDHQIYGCRALEWILHDRLYDIKCITEDSYDNMYKARWIDGYINRWDNINQNWKRN